MQTPGLEINPDCPKARFSDWLSDNAIVVSGAPEVKRLRKSTKVENAVVSGGRIARAADDHHEQTFLGHYAQGTTLRVISGEVITTSQQHWFDQAVPPRSPRRCRAPSKTPSNGKLLG
jgi:hypothetical protein